MSNSNADLFEYTKFPLTANARTAGKWSGAENSPTTCVCVRPARVLTNEVKALRGKITVEQRVVSKREPKVKGKGGERRRGAGAYPIMFTMAID